eukprot:TRINITY_DN14952_c0_g1_i1.p1 TRINITY_DN14952_c0_g1~~TRINITY_DN14952_c0_g1_i1.p1  ORF type:complete len:466 (-),score=81.49 TRINITY_DN14952_c0_g1_i1:65-1462(-)
MNRNAIRLVSPGIRSVCKRWMSATPSNPTQSSTALAKIITNPPVLSYREIKRKVSYREPFGMKLWFASGLVALVASTTAYLTQDEKDNRKVSRIIKMLQSVDPAAQRMALENLHDCLFQDKRLVFTKQQIPQTYDDLVEQQMVEALYVASQTGDADIQEKSIQWLTRLMAEPNGRKALIRMGLNPFLQSLSELPVGSNQWMASASLIMSVMHHRDTVKTIASPQIIEEVRKLITSEMPLSQLVGGRLAQSLLSDDESATSLIPYVERVTLLTSPRNAVALDSAIAHGRTIESPDRSLSDHTVRHLLWATGYGLLGNVYGFTCWAIKGRYNGIKGEQLFQFARKRSKVGRWVFGILLLDLGSELLLKMPADGVIIPKEVPYLGGQTLALPSNPTPYPWSTVIPICNSALAMTGTLWAIRRHHHVVLPLFLAAIDSYYPELQEIVASLQQKNEASLLDAPIHQARSH